MDYEVKLYFSIIFLNPKYVPGQFDPGDTRGSKSEDDTRVMATIL